MARERGKQVARGGRGSGGQRDRSRVEVQGGGRARLGDSEISGEVRGQVPPGGPGGRRESGLGAAGSRRGSMHPARHWGGGEIFRPQVDMMRRFAREMNRMFEDWGFSSGLASLGQWPAIEVIDRRDSMLVRVEAPGLDPDDVRVRVLDDALVIEGERRQEGEERQEGFYQSEWSYGRFVRRIPLPPGVDPAQVQARFQNGVLEITVRVDARTGRDVPIQTGRSSGSRGGDD